MKLNKKRAVAALELLKEHLILTQANQSADLKWLVAAAPQIKATELSGSASYYGIVKWWLEEQIDRHLIARLEKFLAKRGVEVSE